MNVPVDTPMADVNAWGWQGSSKTIKDRTTYMLDHSPIPFNVKFRVGRPGKKVITIEAHKDILAMGSEVFLKMFYGDLADKSEIIDVPDIYPRAFRLMIRFLYTEELPTALMEKDLTLAFEMMKCAGKYGIPYLYIQCRQWIVELFVDHFCSTKNVKTDALPYLRLALKPEYEDAKILEEIWNAMDVCAESVLQTPDEVLRDVSPELLSVFLVRDTLTVLKEKNLHDFMVRWAKLQSSEFNTTESTLRERLGDVFKNIRYSVMDLSELSSGPLADNVLTLEETLQMCRYQLAPVAGEKSPFISQARKNTAAPTMLTIGTNFLEGNPNFARICKSAPIASFAIQVADLCPGLISLVQKLDIPRSKKISTATWSPVKDSILTTFTVRFDRAFTDKSGEECNVYLEDEQKQLLTESAGQVVNLGFGDVAMEVAYSEHKNDRIWKRSHGFRLDSLCLIFGGYSTLVYTSAVTTNSVFYLGHVVNGTTDFSFLRRFIEPGNFFPTHERMLISTKFSSSYDNDYHGERALEEYEEDEDGQDKCLC